MIKVFGWGEAKMEDAWCQKTKKQKACCVVTRRQEVQKPGTPSLVCDLFAFSPHPKKKKKKEINGRGE
jgi:hypothetical protein